MYQSLIWRGILRHDPRRLGAALDSENLKRLADALVDGVRRDSELRRNLLGAQMLVDEQQAVELRLRQPRDPLRDRIFSLNVRGWRVIAARQAVRFLQATPHLAQHGATPEHRVRRDLRPFVKISPDFQRISAESR
jgi:hypothetical protein